MCINDNSCKFLESIEWMTWDGNAVVSILKEKVSIFYFKLTEWHFRNTFLKLSISANLEVEPDDHRELFQPKWFSDFIYENATPRLEEQSLRCHVGILHCCVLLT